MKKIIIIIQLLFGVLMCINAQSQLVPPTRMGQEDKRDDGLGGKCGIRIISKINNLLISVNNVKNVDIENHAINGDGYYEYDLTLDENETPNPQLEISKFADVNSVKFVAKIRPNFQNAYFVEEVEKPITKEEQGTGAILNASLAEIEISSTINDLQVICSPMLEANITRTKRKSDESVNVISIKIPIANKKKAEEKIKSHINSIKDRINELKPKYASLSDNEAMECDELEDKLPEIEREIDDLCIINLYAKGTNQLSIDVKNYILPRNKICYGVLALQTIVREHVSKCMAMIEEGGRLFRNRKYQDAKIAFTNAQHAEDTPSDIIPVINSNISRCDTCLLYERLTINALMKISQLKKQNSVSQTDIVEYYGAAIDFMKIAEKYNPCDYYTKNINTLETFVDNLPLSMKFTVVKWVVNRISAMENGPCPNVELWAYYGSNNPRLNDFSNDRRFRKMVSNNSSKYKLLGTSENNGCVDIELKRKLLPTGFFFRPMTSQEDVQIVYKDAQDIMSHSKGEYNKRQFRMKMYVKK